MPIITPNSLADVAGAASVAGEFLKSAGAGKVPVVATPGTDFSVPTAAERWTGPKTHAALQRVDWTNGDWTGGIFQAISPPDDGLTPDFTWSFATASPAKTPKDHLVSCGWNTSHAGQSADGIRPSWSTNSESAFYGNYSETVPQFEWHLQYTHPSLSPSMIRSITATVLHDGTHCDVGFSGDETYFRNHTGAEEMTWAWPNMFIHSTNAFTHTTNNVRWLKQRMTTGVDANLINLDGNNVVRVGEAQVPSIKLQFDSPIASMTLDNPINLLARNSSGVASPFLTIQTDDVTLIRPPGALYLANRAASSTQLTSSGFNAYLRFDDSGLRIGQASTSDGTQKLSLYGGTPVVQPAGGAATADATWTANNQLMLQTVYNAVRAWKGMA